MSDSIKFIDLFSGIGGFHLALHNLGAECVFASEIDEHARKTYELNFKDISPNLFENKCFNDDILKIDGGKIPDFDLLCAGFPCQSFSQAGHKLGFSDNFQSRGNMFFVIANIIKKKRPRAVFLENVQHLLKHDDGETFSKIKYIMEKELGYNFFYKKVKASDFGLPQHRPRIFMVAFPKEHNYPSPFVFPNPTPLLFTMDEVFNGKCNKEIGFTLRVGGKSSPITDRRNWDGYIVDGEERRLTPEEGKKMMGFPTDFRFPVSKTQAMKQLGNSVAVNAVEAVAGEIIDYLKTKDKKLEMVPCLETGEFKIKEKAI